MATRSVIRFAKRESGVSFNEHPDTWDAQFYAHWDGYPSNRGVQIAESILYGKKIEGWEIDFIDTRRYDLEYIYYVWQAHGKTTWISIFERDDYSEESWHLDYEEKDAFKCIFVGTPATLIATYKPNTNEEG